MLVGLHSQIVPLLLADTLTIRNSLFNLPAFTTSPQLQQIACQDRLSVNYFPLSSSVDAVRHIRLFQSTFDHLRVRSTNQDFKVYPLQVPQCLQWCKCIT